MLHKNTSPSIFCWSDQSAPSSTASADIWLFNPKKHIFNVFPALFYSLQFQSESGIFFHVLTSVSILQGSATDRQSNHHCPIATHHFLHTVALCLVLCNLGQPSCFSLQTSLYITQIRISDCFIVLFPVTHSNSFLDADHKVQFWTLRLC